MRTSDAIILVGGQGTRLKSVISDIPKPLAPVLGKPFLTYLLEQLNQFSEIKRVILATGYQSEKVIQLYTHHSYQFQICFSVESQPLGTGGAVRLALEQSSASQVLIMNGDSFIRFNPHDFKNESMILLKKVEDRSRYGSIELNADLKVVALKEKGLSGEGLISAGIYYLPVSSLKKWPLQKSLSMENDILPELISYGIYGKVLDQSFIDIGTPESYEEAENFFKALQA